MFLTKGVIGFELRNRVQMLVKKISHVAVYPDSVAMHYPGQVEINPNVESLYEVRPDVRLRAVHVVRRASRW
jgi:hypothetical protein